MENLKAKPFWGMCISFEINWISVIRIYKLLFNVKIFKEDIHLNKNLSKSPNLNFLIIF
jgi:hypothetical protein